MKRFVALAIGMVALAAMPAFAHKTYSHQKYFQHYEGTKTCLQCHKMQAETFFHSLHYQWEGPAPKIINSHGMKLGKLNTINDFCTNPKANWIGLVRNSRGEVLSKGCSQCHAGFGKMPSETMTKGQLENIDCLICHASGYRRDLYKNPDGSVAWKPILWKNQVGLDSVAKRISLPKRTMCLRCHAGSGGGPNFKRGDLEYTLTDCDSNFDVHMAKNGNDMQCIDCHAGKNHDIPGSGTDIAGDGESTATVACNNEDCHGNAPHEAEILNIHAKRVYCTVCHIPDFAKHDATDMDRDWSKPVYHAKQDKYSPTIKFEKDVKPVYAWYNGTTWEQLPKTPVKFLPDGSVGLMVPQGSRKDPKSKIYAFKLHRATLPVLKGKNWLIPIVVEKFFADGNINKAVVNAAKDFYGIDNAKYKWVRTERWMGVFHEVQPAKNALKCLDCHGPNGRMNWKALGYDGDPMLAMVHKSLKASH